MRGMSFLIALYMVLSGCSPSRVRRAVDAVTMVESVATTSPRSADDLSIELDFSSVASEFAAAWDSGRVGAAEPYVDSRHGIWLLYDPSIAECPIHYLSLADATGQAPIAIQAPLGMGANLKAASFRCRPTTGTRPRQLQ